MNYPTEKKKIRLSKIRKEKQDEKDRILFEKASDYQKDIILEKQLKEERKKNNLLPLIVVLTVSEQSSIGLPEPLKSHSEKYIEVSYARYEEIGFGGYNSGYCCQNVYKLMEKYRDYKL